MATHTKYLVYTQQTHTKYTYLHKYVYTHIHTHIFPKHQGVYTMVRKLYRNEDYLNLPSNYHCLKENRKNLKIDYPSSSSSQSPIAS